MEQAIIDPKDLETWAGFLLDHSLSGITPEDRVMIKGERICWPLMAVLERRVIQAGAVPMTWLQVLLEWQRDWARQETYDAVLAIAREHGGAYGLGIDYAKAMLGGHASEYAHAA